MKECWLWGVRYLDQMPSQDRYVLERKLYEADRGFDTAPDAVRANDSRMALRRKLNGDTR